MKRALELSGNQCCDSVSAAEHPFLTNKQTNKQSKSRNIQFKNLLKKGIVILFFGFVFLILMILLK